MKNNNSPILETLEVQLTPDCNLRCYYCGNNSIHTEDIFGQYNECWHR